MTSRIAWDRSHRRAGSPRMAVQAAALAVLFGVVSHPISAGIQPPTAAAEPAKETASALLTRTKLLPAKVSGEFKDVRLGDVLKELAAQVNMRNDEPLLWTYGEGFPFAKKVTIDLREQ